MKYLIKILILFKCLNCFGQDVADDISRKNTISLYSGIGFSAIRYEYYDKHKYRGTLSSLGIKWERQTVKNSWKIYGNINFGRIKIEYDDAEIKNGSIGYDLYFPIHYFTVFKTKVSLFIGPSTFLGAHIREQNRIALNENITGIGAWSIGPNTGVNGYLTKELHFSTILRFNMLSYISQGGFGKGFVSINKAFLSSCFFSLYWQVHPRIYLGINYQSNYMNIRKWTTFVSGSDFLLININFKL